MSEHDKTQPVEHKTPVTTENAQEESQKNASQAQGDRPQPATGSFYRKTRSLPNPLAGGNIG